MRWLAEARPWAPLFLLVLLGWLVRTTVGTVYVRIKRRVDQQLPDHLPSGSGAWLEAQVAARSLDLRVLVGPRKAENVDAFMPSARTIILSKDVYEKRDASFWAVAAHELGHALVYRWMGLGVIFLMARLALVGCTRAGTFLLFANILYARPEIHALAFSLLKVSLAAYVVVLVDELLASGIALRILARDRAVDASGLVGAVTVLLAAFMTYAGGFVGQLVLVLERDFVSARIVERRTFVPGAPLGTVRFVLFSVFSLLLVISSLRALGRTRAKRDAKTAEEVASRRISSLFVDIGRGALGVLVVALVWDQPRGVAFAMVCVLGLLASRGAIDVALGLARYLVGGFLKVVAVVLVYALSFVYVLLRYVVDAYLFHLGDRPARSRSAPISLPDGPSTKRFQERMAAMSVERFNSPRWYERLGDIGQPALQIAFVAAVWRLLLAG